MRQQVALALLACLVPAMAVYPGEIPGPRNFTSRIAIVGGGGAGVHMAHLLKLKGFTDVTVIERSNDVGSDIRTVDYRGQPHEIGNPLVFAHFAIVKELVNDYYTFSDELVDVKPVFGSFKKGIVSVEPKWSYAEMQFLGKALTPLCTLDESTPVTLQEYLKNGAMRLLEASDINTAATILVAQIEKYIALHREMFGNYTGFVIPEPRWEVKYKIYGTFDQFLNRSDLPLIRLLQVHAMAMLGLGFFDETPAFYGLMWMTPKVMSVYLNILRGGSDSPHQILKSGLQNLWRRVVTTDNIRVLYNTEARFMERTNDYRQVSLQLRSGGIDRTEVYDFVIWSTNLRSALEFWRYPHAQEYFMFLRSSYKSQIGTMLFDSLNINRGTSPFGVLNNNVEAKADDATYIMWEPYAARNRQSGEAFRTGILPTGEDGSTLRTSIAYAFSRYEANSTPLFTSFSRLAAEFGARNFSSIRQDISSFNPQASGSDLTNSLIYRILEMQGKYGLWYIGSTPSFDSIMAKMEYNKLLVDTMRPPGKGDGIVISR